MRLRSYVVSRGRYKIMKIAAEVGFAVEEFILKYIHWCIRIDTPGIRWLSCSGRSGLDTEKVKVARAG